MNKKSFSRDLEEKKEGMDTVKNDVPENRLQADQQVAQVDDAEATKSPVTGWKAKKTEGKGSELKQQVVSDAITGSSGQSGMGISAAGRGVSGTVGGVLGASNSTAAAGQSRSKERVGKKLDRTATKLNYTPCERSLLSMDESKPLADASGDDQGFNGTYRNEDARSQKVMGAVPADLMFQRSVDYIFKDKLYWLQGQIIYQNMNSSSTAANPTKTFDVKLGDYRDVTYHFGNYLHRAGRFVLDVDGKVRGISFDVDNINPDTVTAEDANCVSAHRLMNENVAEVDRINMDAKAGDEKADIWTPLARACYEPTATNFILGAFEAETAGYVFLGYAKSTTNMSHQLNRAAKDGLDVITPAIEELVGWREIYDNSKAFNTNYDANLQSSIFAQSGGALTNYVDGDPSLMIAAYDSPSKYNNKADLLLQPRGFRMHLQTADNNMNTFRLPKEFLNVYLGQETYSTIDHEYDPILPICITDKANLILGHNLNEVSGFFVNHYDINLTYDTTSGYSGTDYVLVDKNAVNNLGYLNIYVYQKYTGGEGLAYDSTHKRLSVKADSPIGSTSASIDIKMFGRQLTEDELDEGGEFYGYALVATYPYNATSDLVFKVPTVQANKITAYNFHVHYDDILEYNGAGQFNYMYSDLRNNYIVEVKHPLVHGIKQYLEDSIGGKFRKLIGKEVFVLPFIFSTQYMTLAQLVICAATPWISRVRLNSMKDVIYYEDNVHEYPYSKLISLREAPTKAYVNFNYSDYDNPIETKVMLPAVAINWQMPEFFWKVDTEKYVLPWYHNENELLATGYVDEDAACMSMPSIRSGVRLGALDALYSMSEKDIRLSLDRIAKPFLNNSHFDSFNAYKYGRTTDGQIMVTLTSGQVISIADILKAPRELGLCMDAPLGVLTKDPADSGAYKALTADGTASSFRIKVYVNPETEKRPDILANKGVNIHRAANYTQCWYELTANNATSNNDICGLVFGINDEPAGGIVSPFAILGTGAQMESGPSVTTYQRALWTRLQLLPFVISPFDGVTNHTYSHDIYDFAYMFGLAGFRASDYRESVYNREKEVINQGLLFVEDPWIVDSPIVKYAGKDSGKPITRGYEI